MNEPEKDPGGRGWAEGWRGGAAALLDSPFVGLSPFIAFALIAGPSRLELAAVAAVAIALLLLVLTRVRGRSVKVLEVADFVFFAALAVVIAAASDSTHEWLEVWANELANIALVVIAVGSIAIGQPFTLQYAREDAPQEVWDTPQFSHVNYAITWVWAAAFLVIAASGFYADQVLDDPNNLWMAWVIPAAAIVFAAQFTAWYPDRADARFSAERGEPVQTVPLSGLFVPLTGWITAVGIIVLASGEGPVALGIGLIVVGSILTNRLADDSGEVAEA